MHLLTLPYDVRHEIYQHLFPPDPQIYIQAFDNSLSAITPEHRIPIDLLLSCKSLNTEASEYLYNSYLFNIVGKKANCLATYRDFADTLRRHARNKVYVNAFSNGSHSLTGCISIQAGEARMTMLKRRLRGEPRTIQELEREVDKTMRSEPGQYLGMPPFARFTRHVQLVSAACCAIFAMLLVWLAAV